jgi:hypothetical protein
MKILIKISLLLVSFFVLFNFNFPNVCLAVDESLLQKPKVIPGTFHFKLERVWEKIYLSFLFSNSARVKYHIKLLDERFSELNYVVTNKNVSLMEDSSSRFSTQAGVLAETLAYENKDARLATISKFSDYSGYLGKLRDEFPANSSNWLFIQQNIDTLNILSNNLNKE